MRDDLVRLEVDVMVIVETWWRKGDKCPMDKREIALDIRKDKVQGRDRGGGGIAVVTRRGVTAEVVEEDKEENWGMVKIGNIMIAVAYFPGVEDLDNKTLQFFARMSAYCEQDTVDTLLILGDFNARMQSYGDSRTCRRGRIVEKWFEDNQYLELVNPIKGKWTSYGFGGNGRGIPDLVAKGIGHQNPHGMTVHEEISFLSDHRLITINVDVEELDRSNEAERWNCNKLRRSEEAQEKYQAVFKRLHEQETHQRLSSIKEELADLVDSKEAIPWEERQGLVNNAWNAVKNSVEQALEAACGYVRKEHLPNRDLFSEELQELQRKATVLQEEAQEAVDRKLPMGERRRRYNLFTVAKKKLLKKLTNRKGFLYRTWADSQDDPSVLPSFLKSMSMVKKKDSRTKSLLRKADMDKHVGYFDATFGGKPTGSELEKDPTVLKATDHREDRILVKHRGLKTKAVKALIQYLPNGKAPGMDGLPAEAWKYLGPSGITAVRDLFVIIETAVAIPDDWKESIVILVYKKKGDARSVSNYRPISLTCVVRRAYERMIKGRIEKKIDKLLAPTQGGFRPRRSTYDQILSLHEGILYSKDAIVALMDIAAAFDTIDRDILWTRMKKRFKLKEGDIAILRSLFDSNVSRLLIESVLTRKIEILRGLLQGSSLSPLLFNCFIDTLPVEVSQLGGGAIITSSKSTVEFNNRLFADDSAFISTTTWKMREIIRVADRWSVRNGIRFKPPKCKLLIKGKKITQEIADDPILLYGEALEVVEHHQYLGIYFSSKGADMTKTIMENVKAVKERAHWLVRKGANAFGFPPRVSIAAYKSFIRPMMEYGLGLFALNKSTLDILQKVQNWFLTRIFSVPRSTSTDALHVTARLESMDMRNQVLMMLYYQRVINGEASDLPINILMKTQLGLTISKRTGLPLKKTQIKPKSGLGQFLKKNVWSDMVIAAGDDPSFRSVITEEVKEYRDDEIDKRISTSKIASCIPWVRGQRWGHSLLQLRRLSRREVFYLVQWQVGAIGGHWIQCRQCKDTLNRYHFLRCGGLLDFIEETYQRIEGDLKNYQREGKLGRIRPPRGDNADTRKDDEVDMHSKRIESEQLKAVHNLHYIIHLLITSIWESGGEYAQASQVHITALKDIALRIEKAKVLTSTWEMREEDSEEYTQDKLYQMLDTERRRWATADVTKYIKEAKRLERKRHSHRMGVG